MFQLMLVVRAGLEVRENNMIKVKILKESIDEVNKTRVLMKSKDFLKLTSNADVMNFLKIKHDVYRNRDKLTLDPEMFGDNPAYDDRRPYLVVDEYGNVKDHEGRSRNYANIQDNGPNATMLVVIKTPVNVSLNTIPVLYGQFNNSATVKLKTTKPKKTTDTV